jgi:SAM-dependent methyltransferase
MSPDQLLVDFHIEGQRQGPGSSEDTLRALSLLPLQHRGGLQVADLGCGTGASTLVLAQHLNADITAVDLFPAFIEQLQQRASSLALVSKLNTLVADIAQLPFEPASLDLLWSEGAIYNLGFERGLKLWRPFLKVGGYLAVSEITWTTPTRPAPIEAHWEKEYPEIGTAAQKIQVLEQSGFALRGYFVLSPTVWEEGYYKPMERRMDAFLSKHANEPEAVQLVSAEQREIALFRAYHPYFSYGFYVAQKVGE